MVVSRKGQTAKHCATEEKDLNTMKIGKVISRLQSNPRVASLTANEEKGEITVTLRAGFVNGGQNSATVGNAHAARLFIRDAIGPDGRTARPGRPAKVPARAVELPTGFVTRAGDANIGTVVKQNAKTTTLAANGTQLARIRKLAEAEANGANVGLKGAGKAVLARLDALTVDA
jgi:hypothetical protein